MNTTQTMLSLHNYAILPPHQESLLYTCSQCTYYPTKDIEYNFDIMWEPNTRTIVLEYQHTFYSLPLSSECTLRHVLHFLQFEQALIHLGWCYHLQSNEIDVVLDCEVESLAIHHINIYANNSVLAWWNAEHGVEPGAVASEDIQ